MKQKNPEAAVDALIAQTIAEMQKNLTNNLRSFDKNNPIGPEDAVAILQQQLHCGVLHRSHIPQLLLVGLEDLRHSRHGASYIGLQKFAALLSRRKIAARLLEDTQREYSQASVLATNLAMRAVEPSVMPSEEQLRQAAAKLNNNP